MASAASAPRRDHDVIVFGASGFTGKYVVKELTDHTQCSVVVAGRSAERTRAALQSAGVEWSAVTFVQADATDVTSCRQAVQRARVMINCAGPFRFLGENVVKACIAEGCHYLDLCGEPEFIERMQLKYHDEAKHANVLVISACGGDSIPADIGCLFTMEKFHGIGGVAASIESFMTIHTGPRGTVGHYTTWECAVHGAGNVATLRRLRRKLPVVKVPQLGPRLRIQRPGFDRRVGAYIAPFPGSDRSVVRRSQMYMAANQTTLHPVQFAAYFTMPSRGWFLVVCLMGLVFTILVRFRLGRWLLLRFPRLFTCGAASRAGPTQQQIDETKFDITFIAKGYANVDEGTKPTGKYDATITTRVEGPELGYRATSSIVVAAAVTVLYDFDRLPEKSGVHTTASVFRGTSLISRLAHRGITFKVVSPLAEL